MNNHQKFIFM